jgi:hypothetical protein
VDIDTSDFGMQKSLATSQYAPSYSATWAADLEENGKNSNSYNI